MKNPSADKRDQKTRKILEQARFRVIEAIAQNINLYGVTPSVGRLYGTMYFQEEPMTLDQMQEALGMSKTSMSTGVRNLLELKMVKKTWRKGVRKDLYEVEPDWYQTFIDFFCLKWRKGIDLNVQSMKKSVDDLQKLLQQPDLSEDDRETIRTDLNKLYEALAYYEWLDKLVDSLETEEIFEFIPKPIPRKVE
ncbi:MAG: GbsR/MarR family transcriptional regulator [Bacillaceae bacterium]|nr:GbsR/MarR family transcriptional regulator [Bacillaceae bacterium]